VSAEPYVSQGIRLTLNHASGVVRCIPRSWIDHPAQTCLYQVPEPLRTQCLESFLETVRTECAQIHAAIHQVYFDYAIDSGLAS